MRKTENRTVKKLLSESHDAILEIAMTTMCGSERATVDAQKVFAVLEVARAINLLTRAVNDQTDRTIAAMRKTLPTKTAVRKD